MRKNQLIAPCGINCSLCAAHLRVRNTCPGCRADEADKPVTRVRCKMKTCAKSHKSGTNFCFRCDEIPCNRLTLLDNRYRAKYHTNPIGNLQLIKKIGVKRFLKRDQQKWKCAACGGVVCMHTGLCAACGTAKDFTARS